MTRLTMAAERFPRGGGTAGEGALKLLGTPSLTRLQAVVREAGQNSWDARLPETQVRFAIRARTLAPAQTAVLREQVFAARPQSQDSRDRFEAALSDDRLTVLELADFGTRGLAGPTGADFAPAEGEPQNFVKFIRNIGAGRGDTQSGGTYGFGKVSFYAASTISTVLVDSLATDTNGLVRRFIACHLGDEFTDESRRRFTGRHWWGASTDDEGFVEPLTGDDASDLSSALGLHPRGDSDTGTTVVVLAPALTSLEDATGEIVEALLWFFWPKMISVDSSTPPMSFSMTVDGDDIALPQPDLFPPLDLFTDAYRHVKQMDPDAIAMRCGSPVKHLGYLSITRGFRSERQSHATETAIPHTSSHVALMRPVELVVRYLEGPKLPQASQEWAGVFICSAERDVEEAFAASEPPGHDDWCPTNLPRGYAQTFVRVGLRRIQEQVNQFVYPPVAPAPGAADQPSLARAASALGSLVPQPADELEARRGRTAVRGVRRAWTIHAPEFLSIESGGDGVDALFLVVVSNPSSAVLRITASPGVVIDDQLTEMTSLPDGGAVSVVGWESQDGQILSQGATHVVDAGGRVGLRVRVRITGLAAVGLHLEGDD
jgi:hypothetical protein